MATQNIPSWKEHTPYFTKKVGFIIMKGKVSFTKCILWLLFTGLGVERMHWTMRPQNRDPHLNVKIWLINNMNWYYWNNSQVNHLFIKLVNHHCRQLMCAWRLTMKVIFASKEQRKVQCALWLAELYFFILLQREYHQRLLLING